MIKKIKIILVLAKTQYYLISIQDRILKYNILKYKFYYAKFHTSWDCEKGL